jgi:hypothetical protein
MNRSTPRHLLHYVTRRLRLRRYLKDPGDGRPQPQIPAQTLLWALLIGQILRQSSFHAVEALVRSSARRTLSIAAPFCDDTLGYFSERLAPGPTRKPCSPSSVAPSATRPSTTAAGSGWPSTAPVQDGEPTRAATSVGRSRTLRHRSWAISILW